MATPDGFIEISDFSPGIHGDFHASGAPLAETTADVMTGAIPGNGAATIENTERCQVDKTGALVPLPLAESNVTDIVPVDETFASDHDFVASQFGTIEVEDPPLGAFILDAVVGPEVYDANNTAGTTRNAYGPQSLFVLYGFWANSDGTGTTTGYNAYVLGREYREWVNNTYSPIVDFLLTRTNLRTDLHHFGTMPLGQLAITFYNRSLDDDTPDATGRQWTATVTVLVQSPNPFNPTERPLVPAGTALDANEQAMLADVYDTAGVLNPPFTVFPPITGNGSLSVFGISHNADGPLPTPPEYRWRYRYNDTTAPLNRSTFMVSHQGRVVATDRRISQHVRQFDSAGTSRTWQSIIEQIIYSPYGLPIGQWNTDGAALAAGDYPAGFKYLPDFTDFTPAEDNLSLAGAFGTVTNDQLFMVRHKGGGVLISGDLDNPTIRRMPALESTHGVIAHGTQTPIGFVYGSRRGIFLWQGGDEAKHISRQIDGFFWDHIGDLNPRLSKPAYPGAQARFAFWNDLVCIANNYVFNIETDSWWRLGGDADIPPNEISLQGDQPVPYNIYVVDRAGDLLAFPYKITPDQQVVAFKFSQEHLDWRYSWQSHPLVETRGRKLTFQDVRTTATSNASVMAKVDVTFTGYDETGNEVESHTEQIKLPPNTEPQLIRHDIMPNFQAEYVQTKLDAYLPAGRGLAVDPEFLALNATDLNNSIPDFAGDFRFQVHLAVEDWATGYKTFVKREDVSTGYRVSLFDGKLELLWWDGTTERRAESTVSVPFEAHEDGWVGVEFLRDAGGTGIHTINFYTADEELPPGGVWGGWTQLGDPVVQNTGTQFVNASTVDTVIGEDGPLVIFEVRIFNNFTVVARPDFTTAPLLDELPEGISTTFTDVEGIVWNIPTGSFSITNQPPRTIYPIVRTGWAPKIHSVRLGVKDRATTIRHG